MREKTKSKVVSNRGRGRPSEPKVPHNSTWLKAQMLINGITQREVASELKMPFASLAHLVSGRKRMSDKEAEVFAKLLGMSLKEFYAGLRGPRAIAVPAALEKAVKGPKGGDLEITGWVDGKLMVHHGTPKGPTQAPGLPEGGRVRVLRCQTSGSLFDGIDGALVYYAENAGIDASSVGRMCICKLQGGGECLRVVKKGYAAGRFNLYLLNGLVCEEDITLLAASPVIWLKM